MRRLISVILMFPAVAFAAAPAIITITAPQQQVIIQQQSPIITDDVVTVNATLQINNTLTATVEVPGPQGPPGPVVTGSGIFSNMSYARIHHQASFTGITSAGGITATSTARPAVWGTTTWSEADPTGYHAGVTGHSSTGPGVHGIGNGPGVYGESAVNPGVFGQSQLSQGGKFSSTLNWGQYSESYAAGAAIFYQYGNPNYRTGINFAPVVQIERRPAPYPELGLRLFHGDMLSIIDKPYDPYLNVADNPGYLLRGEVDNVTRVTMRPRARNGYDLYAYMFDTSTPLDNHMMRLLSIQNYGIEKFGVDVNGNLTTSGSVTSGSIFTSNISTGSITTSDLTASGIQAYSSNAAAIAAGLPVGAFYRIAGTDPGQLAIVY